MVAAKTTTREGKKMNLNPKYKNPKPLLQKGKLDDSPLVIAFEKKHAQTEREKKSLTPLSSRLIKTNRRTARTRCDALVFSSRRKRRDDDDDDDDDALKKRLQTPKLRRL